jgi:arylsulfatase A-like enzyme
MCSTAFAAKLNGLTLSSGTLAPTFVGTTFNYTSSVPNATSSIRVRASTAIAGATIKVNGVTTPSGQQSAAIALATGSNTVTITATGAVTDTYRVVVTRQAGGGGPTKPNILLIVADDMGAEASSLYPTLVGNTGAVPMPNIESLASRGLTFDNAWASPMCSPTRSTIMTGLYGHHTGVTNAGDLLPTTNTSIYDYIASSSPAAYDMALFGKWHLAGNQSSNLQHIRDLGVPVFKGFMGAHLNSYFSWTLVDINGPQSAQTTYSTSKFTDLAISHIQNHNATRPNDPYFVYVAYNGVHTPNQVPPANLHSVNVGGLQPGTVSNTVPVYKAMVQSMDTEIGRLLSAVDLTKTTVIFIGDNGTTAEVKDNGTGVRGSKQSVYEGGVRVPLIVAGAGVTRRGREDALVVSSDLFATIASVSGISVGQVNDSYSLTPMLTDPNAASGRTYAFTELCSMGVSRYAIRGDQYKMLYDNGTWGLYDLVNDPVEATNQYTNPSFSTQRATLTAQLNTLKTNATFGCFQ